MGTTVRFSILLFLASFMATLMVGGLLIKLTDDDTTVVVETPTYESIPVAPEWAGLLLPEGSPLYGYRAR